MPLQVVGIGGLVDLLESPRALTRIAKTDRDVLTFARDPCVDHLFLPQQGSYVRQVTVGSLVERGFHVHLQQKVDAAAQVQPEIHRQRADS